jgi:hypothetical protein
MTPHSPAPNRRFRIRHLSLAAWLLGVSIPIGLVVAPTAALAEDADGILRLNKQALEAYDNLNLDQAKTLLEKAITEAESSGLQDDQANARSHLNLGMVLMAGFQLHDEAVEHFKKALTIQPDITPPPGLFNPEVQAAFDEVKSNLAAAAPSEPAAQPPSPPQASDENESGEEEQPAQATAPRAAAPDDEEEDETVEEPEVPMKGAGDFLLALGVGTGMGTAKGTVDTNQVVMNDGAMDVAGPKFDWPGGLATSRVAHVMITAGYFLDPSVMLSIDARLQFISGTTSVTTTPDCALSPCTPPGSAVAVMAKANYFIGRGPLRPIVAAGLGGGNIRQVVELKGLNDCGSNKDKSCFDTVTGGPVFLTFGGGIAYEAGSLVILAQIAGNFGLPNIMLNIDGTVGLGLRL